MSQTYREYLDELDAATAKVREARTIMIADIKARIADCDATAVELGFVTQAKTADTKAPKKVHVPGPAKYQSPDGKLNWTGKGRAPEWVKDFLGNGGTLEQLAIPAPAQA